MTESNLDKLLPAIGTVPPADRMLRANWLGAVERSPSGKPLLWPEFVARQGRSVHIVDVREPEELVGPLGHIPGSEWVPPDRVPSLVERLGKDAIVVLVSRAGERSAPLAAKLEELGMPFVGSMVGGIVAWDETGVVGTPGGDSGELLLGLSAVEAVSGEKLSALQIRTLLARRLGTLGRFYLHTDVTAANGLIASIRGDRRLASAIAGISETMQWRRFFERPPAHVREILLEHALVPAHVGCGHLRLMATKPDVYGARPELVWGLLEAFFRARWDGSVEAEYTALPGGHEEGAVLDVRIEEEIRPFSQIPLISPLAQGTQTFVSHPEIASYLRRETAHFLCRQEDALRVGPKHVDAIHAAMEELAATQTAATLGALAAGLPIYRVSFGRGGTFHVAEAGHVPGTRAAH